ncbi:TlpA family protein disulfide reductase [Sphingobacterium lumbrici]|uniref:TlpA family protein disulfide reductase n=1 Tax=Sphingobacterium lumbrici TaxID=2559600 RepID=UPI00112A0D6D|nr:TlpA disulfide reductase family protein [Sphingobacterium lumbrici]
MLHHKNWILSVLIVLCTVDVLQAQTADTVKSNAEQTEARRIKYLQGLRKLSSSKELKHADSVKEARNIFESDIRLLSQDYQRINRDVFRMQIEMGEFKWISDTYVDEDFVIKARVVRPATQEEYERSVNEFKELLNTPENLEREREIAAQIGKPAPLFSVVDVDGMPYDLSQLKGKVVVLNFWFIGCAPCKREMPELNKLVEKYEAKDVVFLAFEVNNYPATKLKAIMSKSFHYTLVPSKRSDVAKVYEVKTYPTSYVIDQSGVIRFGLAGYNPFKLPELDEAIEKLLTTKI